VTTLLDVNVLVALAWPNHVHHTVAVEWFRRERDDGWATCPLTESGFVRVSSHPSISGGTVRPSGAVELLARLRGLGTHSFWTDSISFVDSPEVPRQRVHGHRQVTDAHLLAVAASHGGRLVTFDNGVAELDESGVVVLLRQ
jgi:toxin-antitoxin system PIN domain toxin